MKKVKINIIWIPIAKKTNQKDKKAIEKTIRKHAQRAKKLLKLDSSVVSFTIHPHLVGGGGAESKEWIRLKIPLKWKSQSYKKKYLEKYIPSTVYHEMCHLSQKYVFTPEKNYPKDRLLTSLVREGTAILFEEEMLPGHRPVYGLYKKSALKKWFTAVRKDMPNKNYDYWEWFHGKGKPNWLGYKLGKFICDEAKKNKQNLTATDLIQMTPREVLKLSKIKL